MKVINTIEAKVRGKLTHAGIERVWQHFLEGGTNHSKNATYLTHIINRCEAEGIPYCLHAMPGVGYYITPIKEDELYVKGEPSE